MQTISDQELIEEIRKRLEAKDRAYHDLTSITDTIQELNRKLVKAD